MSPRPTRLLVATLVALLAWLPPESHGASMAGCAALMLLLASMHWRLTRTRLSSQAVLAALVATGIGLGWVGRAPGAAVEPLAWGLLAGAAGLALAASGDGPRLARVAGTALLIASAGVALFALFQQLGGLELWASAVEGDPSFPDRDAALARLGRGRAFGTFATPAALGGFLCLGLPLALGHAVSASGRRRWLAAATALLLGGALLATVSATAVAALLGAVVLAALAGGTGRRRLALAALALGLLLATVVALRGDRLSDPAAPDGPLRLRAGNLRAAAAMATDHPWIGVGPGGFAELYPAYRRAGDNETRHAHQLPLELVAEWGWPAGIGLSALFFVLFVGPLWSEREAPAWRRGMAIGLAAFALQNLADFTAFLPSLLWIAALLRGGLHVAPPRAPRSDVGVPLLAGANFAALSIAAVLAALGGLASDTRVAARAAAFDGDLAGALVRAERATRLAGWDADAALLLARLSLDAGAAEPLARAERAVRLAPVRAAARESRAVARLAAGDLPGAYADLREAALLHPVHGGYRAARDDLRSRLLAGREP